MTQDDLIDILEHVSILDTSFHDGIYYIEAEDVTGEGEEWQYTVFIDGICVLQTIRVYDVIKTLEEEGYTFEEE